MTKQTQNKKKQTKKALKKLPKLKGPQRIEVFEAMRNGSKVDYSTLFNIKKDSLSRAFRRYLQKKNLKRSFFNHGKIETKIEKALVHLIAACEMRQTHITRLQLKKIIKGRTGLDVNDAWVSRFVKRQKLICSKKLKKLSVARSNDTTVLRDTKYFIAEHKRFLAGHSVSPERIFNFDESRVGQYMGKKTFRNYLIIKNTGNKASTKINRRVKCCSIMPVVSAAGTIMAVFYILPIKKKKKSSI